MRATNTIAEMVRSRPSGQGLWALIDQGIVSLGSALTSVLLARSLPPDEFGIAVLLVAVMLFLNTVHASLIIYPLSVCGSRLQGDAFRDFVGKSLGSTLILAVPLCLLLGGVARAIDSTLTAIWIVLGLIAWQLQETTRRALFAQLRHRDAILGDLGSFFGQAVVVGALGFAGQLSLPLVFVAMAVTSAIGGTVQGMMIRPRGIHARGVVLQTVDGISSGRWPLPSNLLGAVIMQAFVWIVALAEAPAAAGEFQATVAIVGVMNPIMFGVANHLTPAIARARGVPSELSARRLLAGSLSQGGLLLLPYALILWLWPGQILGLIYGQNSPYTHLTMPLRLLAIAYLLVFLVHVGNAGLFGLERPRGVLNVQLAGAIILVIFGFPAAAAWGVTGAAVGAIAIHSARLVVCARGLGEAIGSSDARPIVAVERG